MCKFFNVLKVCLKKNTDIINNSDPLPLLVCKRERLPSLMGIVVFELNSSTSPSQEQDYSSQHALGFRRADGRNPFAAEFQSLFEFEGNFQRERARRFLSLYLFVFFI